MANETDLPVPPKGVYIADQIYLYGAKLNDSTTYADIDADDDNLRLQLIKGRNREATSEEYSVVLAYGYSFEGHCYRFDSTKLFIVTGPRDEPAVGCGFDVQIQPPNRPFSMWRIRSSSEILQLEAKAADAKTLILDSNLPGRRSPTSYSINFQMGHRSGRLTQE